MANLARVTRLLTAGHFGQRRCQKMQAYDWTIINRRRPQKASRKGMSLTRLSIKDFKCLAVLKTPVWPRTKARLKNKKAFGKHLAAEAIDGAALSLERIDYIQSRHSLSLGIIGICDGVMHDA